MRLNTKGAALALLALIVYVGQGTNTVALTLPPVPGLVLSKLNLVTGEAVMFTNVSRDATGQPIMAILDPGDGTTLINLGQGASHQHMYVIGGAFIVS